MATSSSDIAQRIQALQALTSADKSRSLTNALFALGAGASKAGAPTLGRPNPFTLGEALGQFGASIEDTRQRAQREKLLGLQSMAALQSVEKEERFLKNKPRMIEALRKAGIDEDVLSQLEIAESSQEFNTIVSGARKTESAENIAKLKSAATGLSNVAKLRRELKAGLITRDDFTKRMNKLTGESDFLKAMLALTSKKGEFGVKSDEDFREAVLNPNTESAFAVEQLADLLKKPETQTGSFVGSDAVLGLQGLADDLGIDLQEVARKAGFKDIGNINNKQQFDRLTRNIVTNLAQRFKGSLSNKELDFLRRSSAGIGRGEEDNIRAVATMKAAEELASLRREELLAEEEKSPSDRRAALSRFRRARKDSVAFLRKRSQEIADEIRQARTNAPAAIKIIRRRPVGAQ